MAILLPDRTDEENQAALDRITGYITEVGGTTTRINTDAPWGRRRLAYTIRHETVDYRDGFYAVMLFDAVPSMISEIERELRLDVEIIRYLLVSDDPLAGEPDTGHDLSADDETEESTPEPVAPAEAAAPAAAEPADAQAAEASEAEAAAPAGARNEAEAEPPAAVASTDEPASEEPTTEE